MQIETKRLLLRDFVQKDVQAVHAFDSDPELKHYRGGGEVTEEDTRAFIQRTQQWQQENPRPIYAFALLLKQQAQMIGVISLTMTHPERGEAELGYRLCRLHWNQGYTTEAARAILSFGFRDLHLHRITAKCHPENVGSRRFLEKVGMCYEGYLCENVPNVDGTWSDRLLYALIEHNWRSASASVS